MIEAKEARERSEQIVREKQITWAKEIDERLPEILGNIENDIMIAIEKGETVAYYSPSHSSWDKTLQEYKVVKEKLEKMGYIVGDLQFYRQFDDQDEPISEWNAYIRWT